MERVRRQAQQYLRKQRRVNRWHKVVNVMGGIVVFCTTYALILPAITMTTPLVCEIPEHTHTEECYQVESVVPGREPACGLTEAEAHTHGEDCYRAESREVCGLEEAEGHTHTDECYARVRGGLTCTQTDETVETTVEKQVEKEVERQEPKETVDENGQVTVEYETVTETVVETVTETVTETVPHTHTDECYEWEERLSCTLPESEGHTHDEGCQGEGEPVLTCEKPETEGHTHTGECWPEDESQGEAVEVRTLICGQAEHTHDDNCYLDLELEEKDPYHCGYQAEHTHGQECYFEDGVLKCTIPEHTHTEECLEEPLPEPEPMELRETFTAESEDGAVILTLHVDGTVLLPQTVSAEETAGEAGFRLAVTESEDMDARGEYAELANQEGEVVAMGVLDYTLTFHDAELDLSGCEVTVEVTPTEAFRQYMDDPQTLGLMTLDLVDADAAGDGAIDGEAAETMEVMFTAYTERRGTVAYVLTRGANPTFTVEYYARLERVTTEDGTSNTPFTIIDTEGGVLPQNGRDPAVANLYLSEDAETKNQIVTKKTLTRIYKTETFEYSSAPGLKYINIILTNQKSNYDLVEIWSKQEDDGEDAWVIHEYDPRTTRITNRPETAEADSNFILITSGTQLCMVYEPKRETEKVETNFYDYNVTDGKIYNTQDDARLGVNGREVTTQDDNLTWANVNQQGINHKDNYSGTGGKLAFGNGPNVLPTGLGDQQWVWNGITNMPNQTNGTVGFSGCTFGLVQNALNGGHIQYNINSPHLFNDGTAIGKTSVNDRQLGFGRVGDTWTLSCVYQDGVEEPILSGLEIFKERWNWNKTKKIYGNDFWPLDDLAGTSGHDLKHGGKDLGEMRKAAGATVTTSFPLSDFDGDHNAYFGMQFGVEFSLTNSYVGPLEYYFFGDDDMWVYLVEKSDDNKSIVESRLICDIGGVHYAVGEYVNLWDYIDEGDFYEKDGEGNLLRDEAGNPIEKHGEPKLDEKGQPRLDKDGNPLYEDYIKKYELYFYYTERGASGSTCWMQFTLPTVVGLDLEELLEQQVSEDTGSLWIQKELSGIENTQNFEFKLELSGEAPDNYMVMGANGGLLEGDNALSYIGAGDHFRLQAGDILVIKGLPKETTYKITEIKPGSEPDENGNYPDPDGYHTEITTSIGSEVRLETGYTTSGVITVNDTTKVVYTNIATYELPATGGGGTAIWYTMGAMLVLGAAYLMYKRNQWIMGEGEAM